MNIGKEFLKNMAYVVLSIGVPVYYIWFNYELVQTFDAGTKLKMAGIVVLLIVLFFGKGYLGSFIYAMPLGTVKKLLWGVERVLPLVGVLFALNLVVEHGSLAMEILEYSIFTNLFAFVIAPNTVLNKKNITG